MYLCINARVCMHVCVHAFLYVCMFLCIRMYVHMYVFVYIWWHACMYNVGSMHGHNMILIICMNVFSSVHAVYVILSVTV